MTDLRSLLAHSADWTDEPTLAAFTSDWRYVDLIKGARLTEQGEQETREFVVLDGCLVSTICDREGREVCVGFYAGDCVVTPNIARTRGGLSLVSIVATTGAKVACIDSERLSELMISSEPVRHWANGVLRDALGEKADREWCLAALGGADRLDWFRERYPRHEDLFTHTLVASFLGVTPVTLSRLRATRRSGNDAVH